MRRFVIRGGRYGGEVCIGQVSKDFVDYWAPKVEDDGDGDLIDFVTSFEWDGPEDESIPKPTENFNAWYECDEIEHLNGYYADSGFFVTELDEDGNEIGDEVELTNLISLFGREAYHDTSLPEPSDYLSQEDIDNYIPVLAFHSGEKGSFGQWIVETEDDFDPYKFTYSILETTLGEFIERVWYDGVELECDFDWADSTGKGYYASVGYMNPKYHDDAFKYTEEYLTDNNFWEDFNDSVEWEKEQAEKNNE